LTLKVDEGATLHGRFEFEAKALELPESQLALAALAALPQDEEAAHAVLARIGRGAGIAAFVDS